MSSGQRRHHLKHNDLFTVSTRQNQQIVGISVLLVVAVFLVFGQTLRHDFINYDDEDYFYANPHVKAGLTWSGVTWAFRTGYAANWHPLTWLSLMCDAQLFGPGAAGPHLTNVLLHAANTVLLFLLLRRLTGAHWRSALVAALFALHPLHVESVAWVSERKDVLSGLFFLLTLLMYARYVERIPTPKAKGFYGLALLFFALGLMSKPMLVTLPLVLLLLDWWPLNRFAPSTLNAQRQTISRMVLEKLPFLLLGVTSAVVTLVVQKGAVQSLVHISLGIRAVNATVSYVRYLHKMLWPVNLAIPYPHPGYWPLWLFCLCAAVLLATSLAAIRFRRQFPFLATGWFWYLVMLVPTIGLVQVGMQSLADRYTYLPLIGIFITLAWGAGEIVKHWRLPSGMIWGLAMLVLAATTARTMEQLRYWQNSGALFAHTIAVTKNNDIAYYSLGEYRASQGRLNEAMDDYLKAIQIRPGYDDALNNLGVALAEKGKFDEAIARIQESIRYRPDKADAHYNLGNIFVMQHKLDEAVSAYTEALRLKPDYPDAHNNLANVLFMQGHTREAIQHYRETLRLDPSHEGAKRQLRALGVEVP
jgi:predicted negative regulator of RcsB-dependent stress response